VETVAAVIEFLAVFGWYYAWQATYNRLPGRGWTLVSHTTDTRDSFLPVRTLLIKSSITSFLRHDHRGDGPAHDEGPGPLLTAGDSG
jgi:hypothetical protein